MPARPTPAQELRPGLFGGHHPAVAHVLNGEQRRLRPQQLRGHQRRNEAVREALHNRRHLYFLTLRSSIERFCCQRTALKVER